MPHFGSSLELEIRYSNRSASRGSVLEAREAGRSEATSATAVSTTATTPIVTGSPRLLRSQRLARIKTGRASRGKSSSGNSGKYQAQRNEPVHSRIAHVHPVHEGAKST